MRFHDKLKNGGKQELWNEYCGFLDFDMDEYMYIQRRLMDEQLHAWSASTLGKSFLGGVVPATIDEFRRLMPLTDYADYADCLLSRRGDMLPGEPVIWIQTTWEGGLRPIKLAPFTREMLDEYRRNVVAIAMLASGRAHGDFSVCRGDRVLYGGAPLPYTTGLIPTLLNEEVDFEWLPDADAGSSSFSERIKKGFSSALRGGVDYFFAIGSVANYISENLANTTGGGSHRVSPTIGLRYLRAKRRAKKTGLPMRPRDLFRIKGFVCAGTDSKCYREALTEAWGVYPIEIAAGTEGACIGCETWEHRGMVFFPNSCFYEFIPESEMRRNMAEPGYTPRTCLMDEVREGESYELVISVLHGGAFMRYRIGDMYRCLSAEKGRLPYFTFIDRVPGVIDIAGFTRITEHSVKEVISISKLGIDDFIARKEFDKKGLPYLHMYIELSTDSQLSDVTSSRVLVEHLSLYFKYFDSDYSDLKKLLGMEPLSVSILKNGSISTLEKELGRHVERINPGDLDLASLLRISDRPMTKGVD